MIFHDKKWVKFHKVDRNIISLTKIKRREPMKKLSQDNT